MVRILCVGNRFYYPDDFGMQIFFELQKRELEDIELVEGGVGGMSLLPYFEDDTPLLLVDFSMSQKKVLTKADIDAMQLQSFDHSSALLYLLKSVSKEFLIYTCNEAYNKEEIPAYANEVLQIAREMV